MIICRSCGAPIEWAITPDGKRIPIDVQAVEDGNILLSHKSLEEPPVAFVQSKSNIEILRSQAKLSGQPHVLFKSHFATCPNAAKHRKK